MLYLNNICHSIHLLTYLLHVCPLRETTQRSFTLMGTLLNPKDLVTSLSFSFIRLSTSFSVYICFFLKEEIYQTFANFMTFLYTILETDFVWFKEKKGDFISMY